MLKITKKILCLFFVIVMLCLNGINVFSADDSIMPGSNNTPLTTATLSGYNKLAAMGFKEDFLNCITEEMMNKIISCIGNAEISDIVYKNNDRPINLASSNNITVKSINVILKDKNTGEITGNCVCIYREWKNGKPIAKQQDFLKIRWYNHDFIYDGKSFYAEDYLIDNGKITVTDTYTELADSRSADKISPGEISYYTNLKYSLNQNAGCAVFNLIPSKPLQNEISNTVSLEYIHYYKTTVFTVILSVLTVFTVLFTVIIRRKKHKK